LIGALQSDAELSPILPHSMNFQPPKGTDDIVAPVSESWRMVLSEWESWTRRFGYPLILTPVFEAASLFERGVGDSNEVVTKQMYEFTDKGGRTLALRPEGTAGVVRAFLDSGASGAWKGAYSGPMFRYEQPQAGRRRQFWQAGVEYLDVEGPTSDAEVIELGYRYLTAMQIPGIEIRINSLGDAVCRPTYLAVLRDYLESRRDLLCDDSRSLVESNPMRVLDCKVCAPKLTDAPATKDHLCEPCAEHYRSVLECLEQLGISFVEDGRLVRGLDYYTRTAFEYVATELDAAQNAVGGGGRYDGLAEALGGRRAPGVGLAFGVDRIVLAGGLRSGPAVDVYVVSESGPLSGMIAASALRADGLSADLDTEGRSVKAQFRAASRTGAPAIVVVNEPNQPVSIRMGEERQEVPLTEAAGWLRERQ
jgi:histidyl-tRNA synthetase